MERCVGLGLGRGGARGRPSYLCRWRRDAWHGGTAARHVVAGLDGLHATEEEDNGEGWLGRGGLSPWASFNCFSISFLFLSVLFCFNYLFIFIKCVKYLYIGVT